MNFKSFLYSIAIALTVIFSACDDDLNSVGNGILPDGDNIDVIVDSVYLTAKTVQAESIYARTINGLVGKYEDDVFGTIKSDYLCQFYCPDNVSFEDEYPITIDSVYFSIDFDQFVGDSLSQMGISLYKVTSPLVNNYYTDIDPTEFCDMSALLGKTAFSVNSIPFVSSSSLGRSLQIDLGKEFGQDFYNAYKSDNNPFANSEKFNEFFPGVYVTSDFGSETLIKVLYSSIDLYYSYVIPKGSVDEVTDTTLVRYMSLSTTTEVVQLNQVRNKIPADLLTEGTGACYLKSPAGVFTELSLPIKDIADMMRDKNGVIDTIRAINLASLTLTGYTEKENITTTSPTRVSNILLIDSDSIKTFFERKKLPDGKYCTTASIVNPDKTFTNTFMFKNVSALVHNYVKKYSRGEISGDNKSFTVIPVEIAQEGSSNTGYYDVGVFHYMMPASSILRTDPDYLKMKLIFSKY
ncbi:DUF4270 domain-containing protein [Dysgonomonas sp. 520]|uniref:DUF4270 domain-containing protein n=1 Tax=Dysgonomonas sp. 520 TaxID=2302931 RepID=UPI0013D87719|nr:DUF4270 domain-containing protein [Dysgonomonas sp. 520]